MNCRHKVARHVIAAANLAPESTATTSKHKMTKMTSLAASRVRQEHRQQAQLSYPTIDACETQPTVELATATTTIITPPPSPQLLLEGDERFLSKDGISHTYYRLHHNNASHHHHHPSNSSEYLLKEAYDIQNARKEITLLQKRSTLCKNYTANETLLSKIVSFPLQEINNGIEKGAGTGSMTWDSSIVMSLYFGMYPEELMGNTVLELGSGVGLGGILTCVVLKNGWKNKCWTRSSSGEEEDVTTSITLTEVNRDILEMLRYNTAVAANESNGLLESDEMHIEKMDWFDFLVGEGSTTTEDHNHSATATSPNTTTRKKKYDTIIASDCIYLSSQIKPLSETITKLLENEGKVHIFSPCNRSHVYNLIEELREEKGMSVHVDTIEIDKFRVRSNDDNVMWSSSDFGMNSMNWLIGDDSTELERQDAVSSGTAKFLHVTASFKRHYDVEKREDDGMRMSGID